MSAPKRHREPLKRSLIARPSTIRYAFSKGGNLPPVPQAQVSEVWLIISSFSSAVISLTGSAKIIEVMFARWTDRWFRDRVATSRRPTVAVIFAEGRTCRISRLVMFAFVVAGGSHSISSDWRQNMQHRTFDQMRTSSQFGSAFELCECPQIQMRFPSGSQLQIGTGRSAKAGL